MSGIETRQKNKLSGEEWNEKRVNQAVKFCMHKSFRKIVLRKGRVGQIQILGLHQLKKKRNKRHGHKNIHIQSKNHVQMDIDVHKLAASNPTFSKKSPQNRLL